MGPDERGSDRGSPPCSVLRGEATAVAAWKSQEEIPLSKLVSSKEKRNGDGS